MKRYKHRDGFDGNVKHVEVDEGGVWSVGQDDTRFNINHLDGIDVASFVDMGWWIEIPVT